MARPGQDPPREFAAGPFRLPLDRVHLLGVLNVNDDSFCGDGSLDLDEVLRTARRLAAEGADILDVGGESARTNRAPIGQEEEIRRVTPVIRELRREFPSIPVSLNTWRPAVAEAGLAAGASILDDMGGLADGSNAQVAARHGAGLVIMHLRGAPKQDRTAERYDDVLAELSGFYAGRITTAMAHGLQRENLLLDPGLDFAKGKQDNLRVLRHVSRLLEFGSPVLLANSRKTFIGEVLDLPPLQRDWGTLATSLWAMEQGVRFFRVHNVAAHRDAVKVWEALRAARDSGRP